MSIPSIRESMDQLISDIIRSTRSISGWYLGLIVTSNVRLLLGYEPLPAHYFTSLSTLPALFFAIFIMPILLRLLEMYVPKFRKQKRDEGWSPW